MNKDLRKILASKVIAIGALGGSGTRAVAQILIDAGIYLGDDLNESYDNLIFTRLFKNPTWYKKASQSEVGERLELFRKYMEIGKLSGEESKMLFRAAAENPTFKSNYWFYAKLKSKKFIAKKNRATWGWKEPNTQIFLDEINTAFPTFRYVHVLRHGLDMAFSGNIQQLTNWGYKYDILLNGTESENDLAVKQLDFWISATREVMKKSKKLNDRFYLLKYASLYKNPKMEIDGLFEFLRLDIDPALKQKLCKIPQKPPTSYRFRKFDLDIFRNDQIEFVKEMGFEL